MKANLLDVNGRKISYFDRGQGKPIVLVHCSSACYREWLPLIKSLPKNFRVLAPDLWGYGKSQTFSQDEIFDEQVDYQIICEMLKLCDEPAHLIGHSYGGAIAIEAARTNMDKIESLTLIEPSCFQLLWNSDRCEQEWNEVQNVAQKMVGAVRSGDYKSGMDVYMSFFLGEEEWASTDERTKERLTTSVLKVAGEFSLIEYKGMSLEDYSAIEAPVTFIQGSRTRQAAKKVVSLLNNVMGNSSVVEIPGAGHMSPMTHARQVVDIVMSNLFIDTPQAA